MQTIQDASAPTRATAAFPAAGWQVIRYDEVDTTQRMAADLSPWSVVIAGFQTGGRGQQARSFTSDAGGLYLTAVVPFDGDAAGWRGFALAVGRSVLNTLTEWGVEDLRLRWPNDLMIGRRKVGGILIEQGGRDTLLLGLGINVTNQPWLEEHTLRYLAGRLMDHCSRALSSPRQLLEPVLEAIHRAHEEFSVQRLAGLTPALNHCWGMRRRVSLEPAGGIDLPEKEGTFAGIDENGHVLLVRPDGSVVPVPEHHIARLVEVE